MKRYLKIFLYVIILVLVIIQFIPVDHSVPETNPEDEFFAVVDASIEVQTLVKEACYDCHSYETEYPWYGHIAPVNLFLNNHIQEGREELNFSIWNTYSVKKASHKAKESVETIEDKSMPTNSFTWTHPEARLTDIQREVLAGFFERLVVPGLE